ncbi:unnamed protein product [Prunus armeniaca]|uniref:Uncharacterized protein n=1 Tax=Prunus armeniaca TaxID=36596 RepID=A0A6J5VZ69_PRUAR|nr:unnamed protein product [Prunus armeniaca]
MQKKGKLDSKFGFTAHGVITLHECMKGRERERDRERGSSDANEQVVVVLVRQTPNEQSGQKESETFK